MPFNDILPALNDATRISSASVGDEAIQCPSGNLLKTSFADILFAICSSGKAGFTAYGSDVDIDVEYLDTPVEVQAPTGAFCAAVAKPIPVPSTARALLRGRACTSYRDVKTAEGCGAHGNGGIVMLMQAQASPVRLLPWHRRPKGEGGLQDKPSSRMVNINKHVPCCTEVKYAILNTTDYAWTNDTIQQKFCDHALSLSSTSDVELGTIKDTVVVTHSMAGLVMSMAQATGKCSFGESSSWVAASSPMMGSMAADQLLGFCDGEQSNFVAGLFDLFGQCPMPASRQSLVYYKEKHASEEMNTAYEVAQEAYRGNVSAAMCSDSPHGIVSIYSPLMLISAKITPHKSPQNDGLVEFQSCAKGLNESKFGNSYKDQFYRPKLNHADTAFMAGDGYFKDSMKPIKWFECLL